MNPDYKHKFDRMLENDLSLNDQDKSTVEHHHEPGHAQTILFILPDGNEKFLHYSYLVNGDFVKEANTIILEFTSHKITLKGINLHSLYRELSAHLPKMISCINTRYNALNDDNQSAVNEIIVNEK